MLLKAGADTTIGDLSCPRKGATATVSDMCTPLHAAAFYGHDKVAQALITAGHGPDKPTWRHADGYTPMHRAAWGDTPGHTETVRVFLNGGTPWDEPSTDFETALQMTNNKETKRLLEKWKAADKRYSTRLKQEKLNVKPEL